MPMNWLYLLFRMAVLCLKVSEGKALLQLFDGPPVKLHVLKNKKPRGRIGRD